MSSTKIHIFFWKECFFRCIFSGLIYKKNIIFGPSHRIKEDENTHVATTQRKINRRPRAFLTNFRVVDLSFFGSSSTTDIVLHCRQKQEYHFELLTFSNLSRTSSISHMGVEVAPETPTVCTHSGRGSVISSAEEIKVVWGLAERASW